MTEQEIKQQRISRSLEYMEEALNKLKKANKYLLSLENIENDVDMEYFNQLYYELEIELSIIGGGIE